MSLLLAASAGGSVVVTPGTATLVLAAFAPTVSTPRLVTVPVAALATAIFAPNVATPRLVTPGVQTLALSTFAPTITVNAAVVVTPGTAHLVLISLWPDVAGDQHGGESGHVVSDTGRRQRFGIQADLAEPVLVTPGRLRLSLTAYAPAITKSSAVAFTLEELSAFAGEVTEDELVVLLAA